MPVRPWKDIVRLNDNLGPRDVGVGRDRGDLWKIGDRGRVVDYIRVKALSLVGGLFKRRPPPKGSATAALRPWKATRHGSR